MVHQAMIWAVLFSIFSTSVMTYISIATPIGPWMGPTLALMGVLLVRCIPSFKSHDMLLAVVAGSLGGIMATAFGFSFPTLYFLDKPFFIAWSTATPLAFISSVSGLALAGGLLGLWVARAVAHTLLEEQQMAFPVGTLTYKVVTSLDNTGKLKQLWGGFIATVAYCLSQSTLWFQTHIMPTTVTVFKATTVGWFAFPALQFTMGIMPMLWSIGFIAGSMITIPLLIGTLSKIFIIDIVNAWYFPTLSSSDFLFAFCSGMVLVGAITSMISMPGQLYTFFKKSVLEKSKGTQSAVSTTKMLLLTLVPVLVVVVYVLTQFHFSLLTQIYLVVFASLCAYQIAVIAGKIGLAFLGRFATFVMIPGIFLFGLDMIQVTVLATFVELCGGIATDALFGRKAALLAGIDKKRVEKYQLLGIVVCSITIGIVMWLLVTHFELGSDTLFAERAQGRALLVRAASFNYYVLACGALYGFILKQLGFNPMLVLGGLLMSLSLTLGLVFGGVSRLLVSKDSDYEPLCSGMFAANSLCMIAQALR